MKSTISYRSMREIPDTAFDYLALGFFSPEIDMSRISLHETEYSANYWHSFMRILLSCESGDFSRLGGLIDLMKANDAYLLWLASSNLAGHAGGWTFVSKLLESFERDLSKPGVIFFMAVALGTSCSLNAVGPLKSLHSMAQREEDRLQIECELSCLLEGRDEELRAGAAEIEIGDLDGYPTDIESVDREEYFRIVDRYTENISRKMATPDTPVFEGEPFNVVAIAKRLHRNLIESPKIGERLHRERLCFEASTGIDCTSFHDENRRLMPLAAAGVMENFLESSEVERFVPGQRYFFGHPIPL